MMIRHCLLALACVALCQAARIVQPPSESTEQNKRKQPDFCSLECLDFNSVCETDHYEVRKYTEAKWVSTTVTDINLAKAGMRGFRRLAKYIDEENDAGVKLPMTQPVLMQVPTDRASPYTERYTVSLLLPKEYWDAPPKPTNTKVSIENTPEMVVYVKSYGGWASGSNANSNYADLVEKLKENNETFKDGFYFSAQYEDPFETTDRHNEIWVLGTSAVDALYPQGEDDFARGLSAKPTSTPSCLQGIRSKWGGNKLQLSGSTRSYVGTSLTQCGDREEICQDKECPEYQVIERYDSGIERRRYSGIKMASLNTEMCDVTRARFEGFWYLYNYINGSNSYDEKISPTAPVLLDVKLKEISGRIEPACDKINTVSFYLPEESQQDTPEPLPQNKPWQKRDRAPEQEGFLRTVDLDVYVQCFNGYAVKDNIIQTYRELRQRLGAEGKCYKPGVLHVASYSDSRRLFARHNEIWLDADDECTEESPDEISLKGWEEIRKEEESEKGVTPTKVTTKPKTTSPYLLPVGNVTDVPPECEISECPKFETVKTYENFVQRSVINATMVCTKTVSCSYEAASMRNFLTVSEYFNGQNSAGVKIAMTAPVLTKLAKMGNRNDNTCEKEYTTCFYLPKEHHGNPPKPDNDELFIEDEPVLGVLVTAFGGWATDDKVDKMIDTFRVQVGNQFVSYAPTFFIASYDAPWKTNRYNELWNLKVGRKYGPKHISDESTERTTETSHEVSRSFKQERCENVECPEYRSIKKFNNFEERKIMPGKWVCKKSSDCSLTQSSSSLWSLLNYMSGSNDRNVTIDMTAPVLRSMNPADLGRKGCDKDTMVCFWLPKEHHNNPPRPTEDGVYLYQSRGPVAYVTTYGGAEETEEDFSRRALKFMRNLDSAGVSFKPEYVKSVTYGGPEVPVNKRLNEIWLIKPEDDYVTNLSEEDPENELVSVEEKCKRSDCPEFRDVRQHNGVVEKSIEPGTWVCRNTRRCSLTETDSAFWSLYDYFAGNNSENTRIAMTSSILHAIDPDDLGRDSCDKLSRLCRWLPREHQKDPPKPTEDGVYLHTIEIRIVGASITRTGGRIETEEDKAFQIRKFKELLKELGIGYKPEYVMDVSYDGPHVPVTKRLHEIWFTKPQASESEEILDPVSEKCKRIECPAYKTIKEHDGFEERRIIPGTWVCKKSTGCSPTQTSAAFMSLFYYISGSNSKNVKMDMTAPVVRMVNPADLDREGCDKEIKTCFWLPEKHQEDPPQPTEDGVFLYKSRGPVAYVLTYSGAKSGRDEEFVRRAKEFMSKLDWEGLKYKREYVKSVGYDGPDVPDSKRVREIWLIKEEAAEDYRGKVLTTMEDRCKVMDCPNYWSIQKHDGFEERRIMPGTWICKNFSACSMEEASTGFSWILVGYISGGNSKRAKIKQETPIVTWMHPSVLNSKGCNKDYTMCLWLPKEHQEDPPKAATFGPGTMFLYHSRGPVVYAMPYNVTSRDKTEETFTQQATAFMDKLDAAGVEYKQEYVKSAMFGGGPPNRELHEVWLVKPEK